LSIHTLSLLNTSSESTREETGLVFTYRESILSIQRISGLELKRKPACSRHTFFAEARNGYTLHSDCREVTRKSQAKPTDFKRHAFNFLSAIQIILAVKDNCAIIHAWIIDVAGAPSQFQP
jgi:hypothetical protein